MSIMSECQCELLTREVDADSNEPAIVSVKMDIVDTLDSNKK